MTTIDSLVERIKLYANGNKEKEIPAHAFDFSKQDTDILIDALKIVECLGFHDYLHNFQREAPWVVNYCYEMTNIQSMAKKIIKRMEATT